MIRFVLLAFLTLALSAGVSACSGCVGAPPPGKVVVKEPEPPKQSKKKADKKEQASKEKAADPRKLES